MNPGDLSKSQWKPIPLGEANHQECTGLHCGSTGKRDKEYPCSMERREPLVIYAYKCRGCACVVGVVG